MDPAGSGEARQHDPDQCDVDPRHDALASPFDEAGGTHRIAVEDGGHGQATSLVVRPDEGAQPEMDGLDDMVAGPRTEITVDGAFWWEAFRKVDRLVPSLEGVEDRANNPAEAGAEPDDGRQPPSRRKSSPRMPRHPATALISISSI